MMKQMNKGMVYVVLIVLCLTGCVNQHPEDATEQEEYVIENSSSEDETVLAAKEKVEQLDHAPRIIATSVATAQICERLDLELVGVCSSSVSGIPKRYQNLPTVGTSMAPDMEVVASLAPDWILSPVSLRTDLQPKYENIGVDWAFLNLNSVTGMYRSIEQMGEIFGRQEQAQALVKDFQEFYQNYQQEISGKEKPKVMILMGLPGSYVIATPKSYVGSLVELAGGENVYESDEKDFLNINTEDMKLKEPDIIIRTAHAMPDQVKEMFQKEFETNEIWSHFNAVQNGKVYDLNYENFGMSANLQYADALEELRGILYP